MNIKQNFFDHLDGGWGDIIEDTYIDANTTIIKGEPINNIVIVPFNAYKDNVMLKLIKFEDDITHIFDHAFCNCINLESVTFPEYLKVMRVGSFQDCTKLSTINFNNLLASIGEDAFKNTTNLKSIKFPESLTYIGEGAFQNSRLEGDLIIPDKVKTIEDNAFKDCINLNGVLRIGKNIEYIGNNSFEHCNFKKIYIPKELEYYNYKNIYKKNVEIIKY